MKNPTLGIIIAGRYDRPDRWITMINDYEETENGKAYITETDNTNHIMDLDDIVYFDPFDCIECLAGKYYKMPNSCLHYVAR